jgi:hypothetical protein
MNFFVKKHVVLFVFIDVIIFSYKRFNVIKQDVFFK